MRFQGAVIFLTLVVSTLMIGQSDVQKKQQERQEKIDLILQIQDRRTIQDGKLINLLSDADPIVRERAARAYGSIQDTTALSLLVDRLFDDDEGVQFSAAFAIGQTAGQLSKKSREIFQHDLIWARLDRTKVADRLIEETGKFGTEEALRDLITRFGDATTTPHTRALIMSIARFAIRGVTTREATEYLLKMVKSGNDLPWEAMYALQRIGDRKETRGELDNVISFYRHHNPLVRMHLAALLGKIKDDRSIEPLQKLAEFEGDWKVKVNALRALSNFKLKGNESVLRTFRKLFFDGNMYVALTALSSIGNTDFDANDSSAAGKELFAALAQIAQNKDNGYLWQLQGEAAQSLAKLAGKSALPSVRPTEYPQRLLQAQLLNATGATGAPEAIDILLPYLRNDDRVLNRAALEGLQELSNKNPKNISIVNKTYESAVTALSREDVAVVTTAASILGDSLFQRASSVEPLVTTLGTLRTPDDVEAIQEIASTLGKLKSDRAVKALEKELEQPDRAIVLACAGALKAITGRDYRSQAANDFEPLYTDFDFAYLHALPETVRVKMETIRGDVTMELFKNVAPFTVMSFLKLATQKGFYRGLTFHRIVPNFVVQGGDPRGDGWGGPNYSIRSEFSSLTYETGMLGIASAGKDTEGSQFFVTQSPQPHLDGRYTIFGKVVAGMDIVDKIQLDDHIFDIKILQ